MKRIKFDVTKKYELAYIQDLLVDKDWFDRENFPIFWPKQTASLPLAIARVKPVLEQSVVQLNNRWRAIESQYFNQIAKFKHRKLPAQLICHVSYFGPEGRYKCPDTINIRLRTADDKRRAIETIGHELIHLFFYDYFEEKKCSYREREWLVDHIILGSSLTTLFSNYKAQTIGRAKPVLLKSILK